MNYHLRLSGEMPMPPKGFDFAFKIDFKKGAGNPRRVKLKLCQWPLNMQSKTSQKTFRVVALGHVSPSLCIRAAKSAKSALLSSMRKLTRNICAISTCWPPAERMARSTICSAILRRASSISALLRGLRQRVKLTGMAA